MRILLVEDDVDLARIVQIGLSKRGHEVAIETSGLDAEEKIGDDHFDVLVIDWMLPGQDGRSLVEKIRKTGETAPVLMLTALSDVKNRVAGLGAGADDYLTKPFEMSELVARVEALRRRHERYSPKLDVCVGPFELDIRRRSVTLAGEPVEVRAKEFALLELLARRVGEPVPREAIVQEVWSDAPDVNDTTIRMTVSTLRQKLDEVGAEEVDVEIETVRGVGYRLVVP